MIHIIGTDHKKTQFWSDAIRQNKAKDTCAAIVGRFELYLRDATILLEAAVIAEENSEQRVDKMDGGSPASVAKTVADALGLRHVYCDPDLNERGALGVGKHQNDREPIWMDRIQRFSPNETSIIFVCGADHAVSFQSLLEWNGLYAGIYCEDWTETPAFQVSEDEMNEWRHQVRLAMKDS
jgi:hypothetical protein